MMKKKGNIIYLFVLTLVFLLNTPFLKSQNIDSLLDDDFVEFEKNTDSLFKMWYQQYAPFNKDSLATFFERDTTSAPYFSDEVLMTQLNRMNTYIEMTFNAITRQYIDFYSRKRRKLVSYMLGNSEYYFPYFEEALDRYGLPLELKYLPVIESALNPRAYSRARAVGLWQFILPTAKLYNLQVNSFIDERMDVIKASDAAARYLRDLYNIFQDWQLAIAAYNCGPLNVHKAIKRSGKTTFWGIYMYLPRETRGYVPAFIGAAYTFHYYKELNIIPRKTYLPLAVDTIYVNRWLHFRQIADVLNIPIELIQVLNPQYKKDIVPASNDQPLPIYLPIEHIKNFITLKDSIYKYKDSLLFAHIRPSLYILTKNSQYEEVAFYHKVKKGETIKSIANKYHVSVADICQWNNLSAKKSLKVGRTLVLYKLEKRKQHSVMAKDSLKINNLNSSPIKDTTVVEEKNQEPIKPIIHYVRKGDTLYSISRKYNVSLDDLCKANSLNKNSYINVGQKLIIPNK